jgi:hypothetical protein
MLMALLRGKLSREQENMEDILTSNVFGVFRYVSPTESVLPFLAEAEDGDGKHPLASLGDALVAHEFWPQWKDAFGSVCEPDVVLRIDADDRRLIVLVEAKYLSGKSSWADDDPQRLTDQLAREYETLVRIAADEKREPALVYATTHAGYPADDIGASAREYQEKYPDQRPAIFWLSWCKIPDVFGSSRHTALLDLVAMADRMGLTFFKGWPDLAYVSDLEWQFKPSAALVPVTHFDWQCEVGDTTKWRFVA